MNHQMSKTHGISDSAQPLQRGYGVLTSSATLLTGTDSRIEKGREHGLPLAVGIRKSPTERTSRWTYQSVVGESDSLKLLGVVRPQVRRHLSRMLPGMRASGNSGDHFGWSQMTVNWILLEGIVLCRQHVMRLNDDHIFRPRQQWHCPN